MAKLVYQIRFPGVGEVAKALVDSANAALRLAIGWVVVRGGHF
jgi:hypothetical protein